MKTTTVNTNLGAMELGAIDILEDSIEVFFDVKNVSADLQQSIDDSIEKAKVEVMENHKDCLRGRKWCEAGVNIICMSIRVDVNDKKEIETVLFVSFEDKEDDSLECSSGIEIDLTAHADEIKRMVLKAIVNKFF